MANQIYFFTICLTYEQCLSYYQGQVKYIIATDKQGRKIQFPVEAIRPYVLHDGISGEFKMTADAHNRFIKLERIR